MKVTDSQRKAIEHDGSNLQLIAGAGSGRTEVVARRVVHLLSPGKGGGLALRDIIAFPVRGYARIAVKVVDAYGNESTVARDLAAGA